MFAMPSHFSSSNNAECVENIDRGEIGLPCDRYQISATNTGAVRAKKPIEIVDVVPSGLSVQRMQLSWSGEPDVDQSSDCKLTSGTVKCVFPANVEPDQTLELIIDVTVEAGAVSGEINTASVFEAASPTPIETASSTDELSSAPPLFGPSAFLAAISGPDGRPEAQAGAHPYEFTTRIDLNTMIGLGPETASPVATSPGDIKDVVVDLPLGFLGNAQAAPKCKFSELVTLVGCSPATEVGHILTEPKGSASVNGGIYNMVPEHGVAAEFGFVDALFNSHAIYASVVPTKAGYILRASSNDIPQVALTDIVVTFWGNPAAKNKGKQPPSAMFTNPSDCSTTGQRMTRIYMDSWQNPGAVNDDGTPDVEGPGWTTLGSPAPAATGCSALQFAPESLSVEPETSAADSPTGLKFDLRVPQSENPETLATPPLKNATVALPAGLTVNPASAGGLASCTEAQIGWLGGSLNDFTPDAPACPEASKIGNVKVVSPLLEGTLTGAVYLAKQDENPFNSLLAGYIVIDDPTTGVLVKIAGELKTDPATGQITGVFDENPQLPFSDLKLEFFGGSRGELATPQACGTYTTTSDLSPWSAPESGPDATPSSSFDITSACGGGFGPAFSAGTLSKQAAAFTPLTLTIGRNDGEQHLAGLTVVTPPGLLGVIANIPRCPEPQATQGTCPADTQIGEVNIAAGVGPSPYWVQGGHVYLTGPYNGGPFGLSVVVPAVAGPFDLGNVVVRSSIRVDPTTSQIMVVSDPLPQMINNAEGRQTGIPADVRAIDVTINRPGFIFNPTNCNQLSIASTITGAQGAVAQVSSPFRATGCPDLAFKPQFSATTSAKTSKANGASLKVKIAYPAGAEANLAKVNLEIPKILPTRLTTIQKACTEAQFNANPAGCPAPSVIATAVVHTPLLSAPLTGPAYFVSHGNEAFPDVELVLQGEGVTLVVDGKTQIKNGITFSRFEAVPDAPFSSFEFDAPQGPYSIFGANGDLCTNEVVMPTILTGQNGAVLSQKTKIEVQGCPNALKIISRKVKKRTLVLKVSVPAAGKLTAAGRGLSKVSKRANSRGTLTLELKAKGNHKLKTRVKLSFVPIAKGEKKLSVAAAIHFATRRSH
jgi:hypothetical protein